ncbi:hypothetical protein D3C75_1104480 [compost metagenome]
MAVPVHLVELGNFAERHRLHRQRSAQPHQSAHVPCQQPLFAGAKVILGADRLPERRLQRLVLLFTGHGHLALPAILFAVQSHQALSCCRTPQKTMPPEGGIDLKPDCPADQA